jgi:hypothetical protein
MFVRRATTDRRSGCAGGFTLLLREKNADLTARADHSFVRTFTIQLASVLAALAVVSPAAAVRRATLPPGWSHAEVNVVIKGQPHTLTYDRGKVLSVGPASLTLKERDGSVVTITVSSSTAITIAGHPGALAQIRPFEQAMTISMDGGSATTVNVTVPPVPPAPPARQATRPAHPATTTTTTTGTTTG